MEKLKAYALVVTRKNVNATVTWCEEYNFDPITKTIQIIGKYGDVIGTIDLKDKDFLRLDVYDETKTTDKFVQTILAEC